MTVERVYSPRPRTPLDAEAGVAGGVFRVEGHLRKLCEALVELLPNQASDTSLLTDVLPSFVPLVCSSLPSTGVFQQELQEWEQRSRQLLRLVTLHGGTSIDELKAKLDRTSQLARRAIESLELLKSSAAETTSLDHLDAIEPTTDADERDPRHSAESNLRDLCLSLLGLLERTPEHGSVISQTMPSMVSIFADTGPSALDQLKAERKSREAAVIELLEIASSHSGEAAKELRQRVARSLASVARVIRALDAMQLSQETDAADVAGNSNVSSAVGLAVKIANEDATEGQRERAADLCQLAGRHQQQRDYESAERLYGDALALAPALRPAYLHRGRVRLQLGKAELAIEDLNEAVRLSMDDSLGFSSRGDALALCGRFNEAISDYTRSLELRPDNRVVRYNRAVAFRQTARLSEAWNELELLVRLDPRNAAVHLNRGLICVARGDHDQAIREFRLAVASNPECQEAVERLWELERAREAEAAPKCATASGLAIPQSSQPASLPQSRRRGSITDFEVEQILLDPVVEQPRQRQPIPFLDASEPPPDQTHSRVVVDSRGTDTIPDADRLTSPIISARSLNKPPGDVAARSISTPVSVVVNEPQKASFANTAGSGTTGTPVPSDAAAQISLNCPGCGAPSAVRWDRLQPGKVFGCRACGGGFTSRDDGTLMMVQKGVDGKWRAFAKQPGLLYQSRWLAGGTVAALLVCTIALSWMFRSPRVVEPDLPDELEPRAQLFAEAWLKRDYRIIRRMTDPGQGPQLFAWHKKHPAPEAKRNVKIAVAIVKDVPPVTTVSVRIEGVKSPDGALRELSLTWKEQNGEWLFLPTTDSRVTSNTRAQIGPNLRHRVEKLAWQSAPIRSGAVSASEFPFVCLGSLKRSQVTMPFSWRS